MKGTTLFFIFFLSFILTSCHYFKDKLIIVNSTKEDIQYCTLLIDKKSNEFFECSAGGHFNFCSNESSPLVREYIGDLMDQSSKDHILYIVFFKESDKDYIYSNIKTIATNKNFTTYKITKKQLDTIDWRVKYIGK
jgi:hypothetical protein